MPKILIIDDQRDVLHFLEKVLQNAGYTVICLQVAPQIQDILEENPDLVIIDLLLPNIAGYTLGKELIAQRIGTKPRVLLISGRNEDVLKQKAKDIQADGYLTKPFGVDELLAVVQKILT